MGQRASAPAAGGLRASGSLPGSAVRGGSHDGELPSRRMVGAWQGRARVPGLPGARSAAGLAPRPCRGPPRRLRSTWVPLGARYHLHDSPSPVWHLQQPGDTRGGRSPWAAGAGAGLGLRLLGAVLQAATSGHLFLAPPGQGRACGGRQAPGLAGAEGYFWPRLLTRPATLSRSLPL